MNQFKKIENNAKGNPVFQGSVKLVAPLSATVLQNSNSKNYRIATVQYVNNKGVLCQCGAAIYEGNYSKGELTIGEEYLANVTLAPNKEGKVTAFMQMSHLVAGGGFADVSDFITEEELVEVTTKAYDGTTIR